MNHRNIADRYIKLFMITGKNKYYVKARQHQKAQKFNNIKDQLIKTLGG